MRFLPPSTIQAGGVQTGLRLSLSGPEGVKETRRRMIESVSADNAPFKGLAFPPDEIRAAKAKPPSGALEEKQGLKR